MFVDLIALLAAAAGTDSFAPHITLLGSLPASVDTQVIGGCVAGDAAFDVELTDLDDSDERFRSVTLRARRAGPLLALHDALRAATDAQPAEYAPHLSLLYGEFDAPRRAELRALIDLPLPRSVSIDAVQLVDTSASDYTQWSVLAAWSLAHVDR